MEVTNSLPNVLVSLVVGLQTDTGPRTTDWVAVNCNS